MYQAAGPLPVTRDSADRATARALAIAPDLAEAHAARVAYAYLVRHDLGEAIKESEAAVERAPRDIDVLLNGAELELESGRLSDALAFADRTARIDPNEVGAIAVVCNVRLQQRRYREAADACGHLVALRPDNLGFVEFLMSLALEQGDLAGAQRVLHAVPATVDPKTLVAYYAEHGDFGWVLDSAQQQEALKLRPDAFDGQRAAWASVRTQLYWLRADTAHARVYADSMRMAYEALSRDAPTDQVSHAVLGLSLAYLGRPKEAVREAELGVAGAPVQKFLFIGAYNLKVLAWVYTLTGDQEKAIDVLQQLLAIPSYTSPGLLRIDPTWAPLRRNPRFQRLIEQTN
jgi:tetratricopeptide (TPR) repeat protein